MREVLAQIHNIATQLENKKAFKQADKLNNIFIKIAAEVEAAKRKRKPRRMCQTIHLFGLHAKLGLSEPLMCTHQLMQMVPLLRGTKLKVEPGKRHQMIAKSGLQ